MRRFALLVAGLALLAGVAAAVSGGATQTKARWVITDLGTLGRGDFFTYRGFSTAYAINDRGQIVGSSWRNKNEMWGDSGHAFLWESGKMRDLGALPGLPNSRARDINNEGQIVGSSFTFAFEEGSLDTGKSRAVLWESGRMRTLAGARASAVSINDRGEVVGWVGGFYSERPALWQEGTMRRLGRVGGGSSSSLAQDVNELTQVVAVSGFWESSDVGFVDVRSFVWENGAIRDLGKLDCCWVYAINDKGQIVGEQNDHATVWESDVPRRLDGTRGASEAVDINERGQIVGWWKHRAALWENGKLTLLPGLPGGRGEGVALGINERGQIVGAATTKSIDYYHAVLWTLKR